MLRPLAVDILTFLLPLGVGALAFAGGRFLRRMPRGIRIGAPAIAVGLVAAGAAWLAGLMGHGFAAYLSAVGGGTVVLAWSALFLLGVAWVAPGRSFSTGFLGCLVALAGCLVLIESSGRLWWRSGGYELWQNAPDAEGNLRQTSGLTCSPAAAAMLLHRHGIPASEGEMAYLAGTSLFGTDAPAIARALQDKVREHGWHVVVDHTDFEACVRHGQPFLAHVQGLTLGHAVLVERASPEGVDIVDPLYGMPRSMSREDFERFWDGTAVRIERAGG